MAEYDNWTNPRTLMLLGASSGFLDPRGGVGAGFQGAMQGLHAGNMIQEQRAQSDAARRKIDRQMQIADTLKNYSLQHGADPAAMSKALIGSNHPELIKLGIDISKAKSVKSYIKGLDDKGNPQYYAGYSTGEVSPTGITPAEKLMEINRGGQIDLANPYTGVAQKTLDVGMTPGQSAQLAQSQRHFNLSHELARQNADVDRYRAVQPKYVDGAFVYPPTGDAPQGSIVKTDMYTPPKGSKEERSVMAEKIKNTLGSDTEELIKKATGSTIGSGVDTVAGVFGAATSGASANATLKLRAATLAGNMPRFEGPQSDADRKYYLEMAGNLADPSRTTAEKLMALKELKRMHKIDGDSNPTTNQRPQNDGWGDLK